MRTWTAQKLVDAAPERVLALLTDTDAVREWSPLPFDVDAAGATRLDPGARVRVSGSLAGRRVGFDVEVHEATDSRFALSARGTVAMDVAYQATPAGRGSEVCASVSVRPGGRLFGRVATEATAAFSTPALGVAVDRIARTAAA